VKKSVERPRGCPKKPVSAIAARISGVGLAWEICRWRVEKELDDQVIT